MIKDNKVKVVNWDTGELCNMHLELDDFIFKLRTISNPKSKSLSSAYHKLLRIINIRGMVSCNSSFLSVGAVNVPSVN